MAYNSRCCTKLLLSVDLTPDAPHDQVERQERRSSLLVAGAPAAVRARLSGDGTYAGARQEAEAPAGGAEAAAPPADAKQGLATLVEVKLPLGSGGEAPLKQIITRARERLIAEARQRGDGRRPILVLDFVPTGGAEGTGSQFETVLSLARFLESREMSDVKTVAWIPRTIRGHGVLAAIACEEIVMAADAELGDASADEPADQAVSRTVVEAYREIADAKRTIPVALAVGMIDPAVEVVQIESEEGVRFLLRDEVEAFRADNEVINESILVPAGSLARFTDARAGSSAL